MAVRPLRLEAPDAVIQAVRQEAPRRRTPPAGASQSANGGELCLVDGVAPEEILDPAAAPVAPPTRKRG